MKKLRTVFVVSLAFILIFCEAGTVFAQADSAAEFEKAQAQLQRDSAASRRADAERMTKQAAELRELEKSAREYAKAAKDVRDRVMWEEDAEKRAAQAQKLEEDAAKQLGLAGDDIGKAEAIENPPPTPAPPAPAPVTPTEAVAPSSPPVTPIPAPAPTNEAASEKKTCDITEISDLLGMWHFEGDINQSGVAIVQANPDSPSNALELHSHERVWEGTFNPSPNLPPDQPRVKFTYKPKAEEINPDIPEAGRQEIAGTLEWILEIREECDGGAASPYAIFFPGEVKWEGDEGENAHITGKGKERRKNLMPEEIALVETEAESFIGISLGGGHDYDGHPVEALTKNERFHVVVRLPEDLAREVGQSLSVTLEGKDGGDSDTLELQAGAMIEGKPVSYMNVEPVTLADGSDATETDRTPPFLSINWVFGNTGDRLGIEAENEEIIKISYQDINFEVPLYNSWVQRGIVRFAEGAGRLRAIFDAIVAGPHTSAQKDAARKRLQMLDNYEALIASGALNDVHRYEMGELYIGDGDEKAGLVEKTDAQIEAAYQDPRSRSFERKEQSEFMTPMVQAYLEGLSGKDLNSKSGEATKKIAWTSPTEQQQVEDSIRGTTRRLRDELIKEGYKNLSFGMYQGFVSATGTEDAYILLAGKDAFGKKVPSWQRITSAVGLASGVVLKLGGGPAVQNFASRWKGTPVGLPKKVKVTYRAKGASAATRTKGLTPPETPKSLSPAQKRQTSMETFDNPPETNHPKNRRTLSHQEAMAALDAELEQIIGPDPDKHPRAGYIRHRYPRTLRIVKDHQGSYGLQMHSTCQGKTLEWVVKKRYGVAIGEMKMDKIIQDIIDKEPAGSTRLDGLGTGYKGLTGGYPNWAIREAGQRFSIKVSDIRGNMNSRVKLRGIKAFLDKGASVKAIIKLNGTDDALHAVSVEKIVVNKRGFPTHVQFFDSNLAAVVELPSDEFSRMLLRDDKAGYGAVTIFE